MFVDDDLVRGLNKKLDLDFGDQELEFAEWTRTRPSFKTIIRKKDSLFFILFFGNSVILVRSVDFMLGVLICRHWKLHKDPEVG